jgi:hypothetical protein
MKHTHYFTHLSGNNWICSCGKEINDKYHPLLRIVEYYKNQSERGNKVKAS